jgi:hypothetical protein
VRTRSPLVPRHQERGCPCPCPGCGTVRSIPADLCGKKVRCKDCRHVFIAAAPKLPEDEPLDVLSGAEPGPAEPLRTQEGVRTRRGQETPARDRPTAGFRPRRRSATAGTVYNPGKSRTLRDLLIRDFGGVTMLKQTPSPLQGAGARDPQQPTATRLRHAPVGCLLRCPPPRVAGGTGRRSHPHPADGGHPHRLTHPSATVTITCA